MIEQTSLYSDALALYLKNCLFIIIILLLIYYLLYFSSGSEDSTIRFWDLETGNCEHTLNGHKYGVWSLQFDDRILVSGAEGILF
jgi:WD40 repeat protein